MQELNDIHSHSHSGAEVFSPFQRCARSTACSLSAVSVICWYHSYTLYTTQRTGKIQENTEALCHGLATCTRTFRCLKTEGLGMPFTWIQFHLILCLEILCLEAVTEIIIRSLRNLRIPGSSRSQTQGALRGCSVSSLFSIA